MAGTRGDEPLHLFDQGGKMMSAAGPYPAVVARARLAGPLCERMSGSFRVVVSTALARRRATVQGGARFFAVAAWLNDTLGQIAHLTEWGAPADMGAKCRNRPDADPAGAGPAHSFAAFAPPAPLEDLSTAWVTDVWRVGGVLHIKGVV